MSSEIGCIAKISSAKRLQLRKSAICVFGHKSRQLATVNKCLARYLRERTGVTVVEFAKFRHNNIHSGTKRAIVYIVILTSHEFLIEAPELFKSGSAKKTCSHDELITDVHRSLEGTDPLPKNVRGSGNARHRYQLGTIAAMRNAFCNNLWSGCAIRIDAINKFPSTYF